MNAVTRHSGQAAPGCKNVFTFGEQAAGSSPDVSCPAHAAVFALSASGPFVISSRIALWSASEGIPHPGW